MDELNNNRRWYCVSREGLATLCSGRADAELAAAQYDAEWPCAAPHVAVQLGDVRAERERCAAICDSLTHALDNGGNAYRREAFASQCAAAIRKG